MTFVAAVITLILVMDPFGNIPVFLSILGDFEPGKRRLIIVREMFIALIILIIFLFFGNYILSAMNITKPALGMAGGIILFIIAIKMIFPGIGGKNNTEALQEPLVVPLAIPLIAGPSSIAMITLLSGQNPDKPLFLLAVLGVAWSTSLLTLLLSGLFQKILGRTGLKAVERLMGMILTTMAAQMFLDGLSDYLVHIK